MGVADFKSVLLTGTCRMRAPAATVTLVACPASVVIVMVLPETALTVPRTESAEAAAAPGAVAGAWAIIGHIVPARENNSPAQSKILKENHLFRVAMCILIQTVFWNCLSGQRLR